MALPKQLFYNTGISARLWFLRRGRCQEETLFIDASSMGFMEDRTHRAFADEDTEKIRDAYLNWRACSSSTSARKQANDLECARSAGTYEDEKGFCKAASLADIEKHNFILTPGRHVGIPDEEDDGIPYEDKIAELAVELITQIQKAEELNQEIQSRLAKVGIALEI